MESLLFNFIGKVRHVSEGSKEYLVAPVTMIVPGVLSGSKGPLLYKTSEIAKNHQQWDGMPLLIDHPHHPITNEPLSAQDSEQGPAIIEKQGVGEVRNTTVNGKLKSEGWFDEAKLKKLSPTTHKKLLAGQPVSVSTGLFTDNIDEVGSFHGRPYIAVATNFRPDHLAILPTARGACDISDGCGVLVNKASSSLQEKILLAANANPEGCNQYKDCGGSVDHSLPDRSGDSNDGTSQSERRAEAEKSIKAGQYKKGGIGGKQKILPDAIAAEGHRLAEEHMPLDRKMEWASKERIELQGKLQNAKRTASPVGPKVRKLKEALEIAKKKDDAATKEYRASVVKMKEFEDKHGVHPVQAHEAHTGNAWPHYRVDTRSDTTPEYTSESTAKRQATYNKLTLIANNNLLHAKLRQIANSNENRDELGRFASGGGGSKGSGKGSSKVHGAAKRGLSQREPDETDIFKDAEKKIAGPASGEKLKQLAGKKADEARLKLLTNVATKLRQLVINPFVSEAQRRYLWANEPEIAEAWAHGEHTSDEDHNMPEKTGRNVKGPMAKAERKVQREARKATREKLQLLANYSEDQPRDESGKFSSGGGGSRGKGKGSSKVHGAAKEGHTESHEEKYSRLIAEGHNVQAMKNDPSVLKAYDEATRGNKAETSDEKLQRLAGKKADIEYERDTGTMRQTKEVDAQDERRREATSRVADSLSVKADRASFAATAEGATPDDHMEAFAAHDEAAYAHDRAAEVQERKSSATRSMHEGKASEHREKRDWHKGAAEEGLVGNQDAADDQLEGGVVDDIEEAAEGGLEDTKCGEDGEECLAEKEPVENTDEESTNNSERKEPSMAAKTVTLNAEERKTVIDGLISEDGCCFEESEREVLNSLSDRTLARLTLNAKPKDDEAEDEDVEEEDAEPELEENAMPAFIQKKIDAKKKKEEKGEEVAENRSVETKTTENVIAAPQLSTEDQQFLAIGRKMVSDRRLGLIKTITDNSRNLFKKDELTGMTLDQLEKLGQLAAVEKTAELPSFALNRASYFGASVPMENANVDDGTDEDPLPLPVINWREKVAN